MRLHQNSFDPSHYRGWLISRMPSGGYAASSPDFAITEMNDHFAAVRGGFVTAGDRLALIAAIDRREV